MVATSHTHAAGKRSARMPITGLLQNLKQYTNRPGVNPEDTPVKKRELEACELCHAPLAPVHRHLLETRERRVVCSCDPCALRFQDVVGGRFKLIPRDPHALPDFKMEQGVWEGFSLPINLVFFFFSAAADKVVALYPSPAGAIESLLPMGSWEQLVEQNPVLSRMEPDVEALLVNRVGDARACFLAPMDRCYELVGLIRIHWRGLSGGEKVWNEVTGFFERLAADSQPLPKEVISNA